MSATSAITASTPTPDGSSSRFARAAELFRQQQQNIIQHTDRLFAWLMLCQWLFAIVLALWLSPRTWAGTASETHPHVWYALILGGIITFVPVLLAWQQPGKVHTRHSIAIGQMLMSALLIHLTGGRIETHFHVFGSLAILAFYRDWRVLISASVIVYIDHLLRGIFWPQSVYGVLSAPVWRSLEHAAWVLFEVVFLIISVRKSTREMHVVAERQANLEALKETIEGRVAKRTAALTREIAERRQVEAHLRRSQAQLAEAQRIARLGSWEWDVVQNQVTWSEETGRLYGHEEEDDRAPMKDFLKLVHPDDLPQVNQIITEAMKTGEPFTCTHRVSLPDGTERSMHGQGQVLRNERGEPIRMLGVVQDVTKTRQAEEALHRSEAQLRQSQKMEAVGRLAGGIAHDFNNLLTVITSYGALSLQRLGGEHPAHRYIEEIQKASDRASSLTGQLLAFSRKQVLQPSVLNLNGAVRGMEKILRRLIGEDIELSIAFDEPLGRVKADPGQIEQVVLNLAVNARDAMPNGGKLAIRVANVTIDEKSSFRTRVLEPGEYVMLAVSDNGVGMTDEVKAHLFEPFFTTKGVGKGTGLGLATSYGIICQSGGDIRVYSEPNSGTTFKIYLPRTDATAEPAPTKELELPCGTESILVVEDDAAVRQLTTEILRECGYDVQESSDGVEALELITKESRFDLVITDVVMPKMSGQELRLQLCQRIPHARVLLMSGYTDDALVQHGVSNEGLAFLEKPFSPARLARKVREVLDVQPAEPSPAPPA
ncbi:MAG: response regulator [Opitutales bacterium]